jgi:hypothetical protein
MQGWRDGAVIHSPQDRLENQPGKIGRLQLRTKIARLLDTHCHRLENMLSIPVPGSKTQWEP